MKRYALFLALPTTLMLLIYAVQHGLLRKQPERQEERTACELAAADKSNTMTMPDTLHFELDASGRTLTVTNPDTAHSQLMGLRVQWEFPEGAAGHPDAIMRQYSIDATLAGGESRLISLEPFPVRCTQPFVMTVQAIYPNQTGLQYKPVLVHSVHLNS